MEEPPPVLEPLPKAPPPHAFSLAARLLNVFAIPGEVFAGVRISRISIGNWLVPALLLAGVGVVTTLVTVAQPSIQRLTQEPLEQYVKTLDQQVQAGQLKRSEAALDLFLRRLLVTMVSHPDVLSVAVALGIFARVFWLGLILWLLGRVFLKVRFGYPKALEVAGLGLMINVLGAVVILLLMLNVPRLFSSPGLGFAVSDFDTSRQSPLLVGAANLFSLWSLGVLSVGLAKLAGVPFFRAAWLVFAAWAIQQSLFLLGSGVLLQLFR
jgi:hypothetical protein